ncbi:hypothetical protein EGR_07070 [Echinococcus granulosus]|uniref:Uncharacterized protein n=1 Tax=Echinococcus granulosus TaxID=6210 RepID=W6UAF0_ECHGR|nr:hypothetical protein EGR_07070 [Echinococcus granulosus]EUB58050.1 hypothetical protein EGR_07070 [Echinococcus granulosus]
MLSGSEKCPSNDPVSSLVYHLAVGKGMDVLYDQVCFLLPPMQRCETSPKTMEGIILGKIVFIRHWPLLYCFYSGLTPCLIEGLASVTLHTPQIFELFKFNRKITKTSSNSGLKSKKNLVVKKKIMTTAYSFLVYKILFILLKSPLTNDSTLTLLKKCVKGFDNELKTRAITATNDLVQFEFKTNTIIWITFILLFSNSSRNFTHLFPLFRYGLSRIEGMLQDCYEGLQAGKSFAPSGQNKLNLRFFYKGSKPSGGGLFDTVNQCYMKDFGQYVTSDYTAHQRASNNLETDFKFSKKLLQVVGKRRLNIDFGLNLTIYMGDSLGIADQNVIFLFLPCHFNLKIVIKLGSWSLKVPRNRSPGALVLAFVNNRGFNETYVKTNIISNSDQAASIIRKHNSTEMVNLVSLTRGHKKTKIVYENEPVEELFPYN